MTMANERKMTLRPQADAVDIDDLIASAGGSAPDEVPEPAPPTNAVPMLVGKLLKRDVGI